MSKSKAGRKGQISQMVNRGRTDAASGGGQWTDSPRRRWLTTWGMGYSTFYEWQARFPELREAVNKSREVADREVENALFRNAVGYEYEETRIIKEEVDGKERVRVEKVKNICNRTPPRRYSG